MSDTSRQERAPAKINLTLEITGKRPDGYHDIKSVMQAVDLYDELEFRSSARTLLYCNCAVLASPQNLVYRAIKLLRQYSGSRMGVSIKLKKNIPMAGGLGGGSSDAAATLRALNDIWSLQLSREELVMLGSRLGSDVPFFVSGAGTALVEGRGERIKGLAGLPGQYLVLLRPRLDMAGKTGQMYARVAPADFTNGEHTGSLVKKISRGSELSPADLYNGFEHIAFSAFPGLSIYRQRFLDCGAGAVHLAGSGPSLFTLVDNRAEGEEILRQLREARLEAHLVQTV